MKKTFMGVRLKRLREERRLTQARALAAQARHFVELISISWRTTSDR